MLFRSQQLVVEMLRFHGLRVSVFADAETAWPEFLAGGHDLVLTDIVLAGRLSGLQLIKNIRRLEGPRGDTPILAMTAFEDTARRLELFRAGVNYYVPKPLVRQEFIARIGNLLQADRLKAR